MGKRKAGRELKELELPRKSSYRQQRSEREGEMVCLLEDNIGYADLAVCRQGMVDGMFELFTKNSIRE